MPQEWVEVNIAPSSSSQPERLIVDVVDPLVHGTFAGRVETWFFGWYRPPDPYHLRLRIRWQRLEESDNDRTELFSLLDAAQQDGRLATWWEGNHGARGDIYRGEATTYGYLWDLSCKDWQSSSELALAMVKQDPDNRLSAERQEQWGSRTHLHANRLGWDYYYQALFHLFQARFYLAEAGKGSPRIGNFVNPMNQPISQLIAQLTAGP